MVSCVLIVMERLAVAVCWGLPASFTVILAETVPAVVGVPLITPVLLFIVNPAGKPVADHIYGVVPPVAATVALYRTFATPAGREMLVIASLGLIVMERLAIALCWGVPASFTVMLAVLVPAVVGVPLITPVLLFIVNPAGKPVADQVYGFVPLIAATVAV